MDVVLLTPDREKDWQHFVEAFPRATPAHLLGWRNVVEKTYHHTPYYMMALDGQSIAGILPLFLIRSPLFGRFLVTAPYLSYGGLLAHYESAARALIQTAKGMAMKQRAKYVEIRGLSRADPELLPKDKYCTFLLPLASEPAALWPTFERRAQKAVRKAIRAKFMVHRGHHLLKDFVQVIGHHMRDLGTPFHGVAYFRNILTELPSQSEILMATLDGRYVGGVLLVSIKDALWPVYGGALKEFRSYAPMSFLIWETICYGCERRFAYLDFGRSRWGSGTFFFKQQWGAQPCPLFYEYHIADGMQMPDLDPSNPRFRLPTAVWKRLPLAVTNALGPMIIRDIA